MVTPVTSMDQFIVPPRPFEPGRVDRALQILEDAAADHDVPELLELPEVTAARAAAARIDDLRQILADNRPKADARGAAMAASAAKFATGKPDVDALWTIALRGTDDAFKLFESTIKSAIVIVNRDAIATLAAVGDGFVDYFRPLLPAVFDGLAEIAAEIPHGVDAWKIQYHHALKHDAPVRKAWAAAMERYAVFESIVAPVNELRRVGVVPATKRMPEEYYYRRPDRLVGRYTDRASVFVNAVRLDAEPGVWTEADIAEALDDAA